jgi:hypothetical protein
VLNKKNGQFFLKEKKDPVEETMKKLLIVLATILSMFFSTNGMAITYSYNATGTWTFSTYNSWNNCGEPNYNESGSAKIIQNGNNVTISIASMGITFRGIVNGLTYSLSATYPEDGGTTRENITFSLASSIRGYGASEWTWTSGGYSCRGRYQFSITKRSDFSINGSVMNVCEPNNSSWTHLRVNIGTDFRGTLPNTIDSITVSGPNGLLSNNINDFNFYPQLRAFFLSLPGAPALGTYTFYVTSGGLSSTAQQIQVANIRIPIPNLNSFSPSDGAEVSSETPTFSWGPTTFSGVYYQLEISDQSDSLVFTTNLIKNMLSFKIPKGFLKKDETYNWRVRITENSDWIKVKNCSNSHWFTFTVVGRKGMPWIPLLLLGD